MTVPRLLAGLTLALFVAVSGCSGHAAPRVIDATPIGLADAPVSDERADEVLAAAPQAAPGAGLTLPPEVSGPVGAFVSVPADTEGEVVRWVAVDPGLNLFPADLLRDTRTAVVTARAAGRYRVLAYTAIDGEPSEPALTTVVIGDAPPVPPGPPTPPTPPVPPTPPDLQGLAKVVYEAARERNDPATANAYAENFAATSSAVAAGAYAGKPLDEARRAIFADLAAANRTVSQANPSWSPFVATVGGELNRRQNAGELGTLAAIGAALDDIATGLEAAAR